MATYIKKMREKNGSILFLDAGDLLSNSFYLSSHKKKGLEKKADLIMKSLDKMGLDAFTPGDFDFILGEDYLIKKANEVNFPFLSANLIDRESTRQLFGTCLIKKVGNLKVAILGIITDQLTQKFFSQNPNLLIKDPFTTAKKLVQKLEKRVDLIIALSHQGLPNDKKLAKQVSGIDIIVGAHTRSRLREPIVINNTIIVQTGGKGQQLGRLDLNLINAEKPFHLISLSRKAGLEKQQGYLQKEIDHFYKKSEGNDPLKFFKDDKVSLDRLNDLLKKRGVVEEKLKNFQGDVHYLNTFIPMGKKIKNDPEINGFIEDYKQDMLKLRKKELSESRKRMEGKSAKPGERLGVGGPFFVGERSCRKCHKKEYKMWKKSRHAKAYQSLVKSKRHYELECIGCHTIGFEKKGGFRRLDRMREFKNVQCESCHGPGSLHRKKDGKIIKKVAQSTCLECHNRERDPDFNYEEAVESISMGKSH